MSEEKVTYNPCQGWGCHEGCILTTYSKDGKIIRTERTLDPVTGDHLGGSMICQKGITSPNLLSVPSKLKYPLKRVGERGEGKFERISWDQALDEIGAKLNEIRAKYGAESVLINSFLAGCPNGFNSLNYLLSLRFLNTFGATLLPVSPVDVASVHSLNVTIGSWINYAMYDTRLFHKAKHIIIWGGNPIGWTRAAITSYHLMEAQEKGTKLTDIGIVFDSTAAKVDEFIPINPGTDTALAFAMCNVMLKDNIWSSYFMANYTVAPFLVRDDNGEFLRESDIVEGGNRENFVFWNKVPIGPRFLAPHTKISEKDSPDLFAEVVVNGIPCKTAMVHIKNLVEPWTPETQEKITGIPADVVRKLTHEYVETENALIYEYYGPRYLNGGYYGRAVLLVVALSGQMLNEVGGFALGAPYSNDYPVALNNLEIVYPEGFENAKGKTPLVFSDMLRQGFPYKALLSVLSNPLQNWPNRDMWAKEIFPKLDLIVVHDYRMTDTAKFADYVLPDTTTFERNELYVPKGGYAILCEAAIEPVGEPKIAADFWFELSKRVGLEEYFHKSTEEWFEIMLQTSDPAITSLDPPLTLDRLKKEKMVKLDIPEAPRIIWGNLDFPTASGRIDLYCEFLADVGGALPLYVDPLIHGPANKSYPLQFMAFRQRFMMQSQFNDLPHLLQIAGPKPDVAMNPVDAKARGILSGDIVEVFNERGSFKAKVTLTNQLAPGMVRVVFAYPADSWDGDPPQKLMYPLGTPEMDDPVTMKWSQRSKTLPLQCLNFDALLNGWETLWDNLCEVRKVEGGK